MDLRPLISFSNRVTSAHWDEAGTCWVVRTDKGASVRTRYLLSCLGPLTEPKMPPFKGTRSSRDNFCTPRAGPRAGST
ncbi:MAG: hypothetical protein ACREUE_05645 [Panacagrimonas sp.]